MKKTIVSILVIGLLSTISISNANAFNRDEVFVEKETQDDVWGIEIVDSNGRFTRGTSLAIDSNGNPHICYLKHIQDKPGFILMYAKWTGSEWDHQDLRGYIQTISSSSIFLDSMDRPHIAYSFSGLYSINKLIYTWWNGSAWKAECVDEADPEDESDPGINPSIVLDEDDNPHIGYTRRFTVNSMSSYAVRYAFKQDSKWQVEELENSPYCNGYCSIALDSEGVPHIAFEEKILHPSGGWFCGGILKHATRTSNGWTEETLNVDNWFTEAPSLAIDSNDELHICYYDYYNEFFEGKVLYYVHKSINGLEEMVVDATRKELGYGSRFFDIAVDSNNNPHISYKYNDGVKYATLDGSSWRIELVGSANEGQDGYHNSIALDSDNKPYICYNNNFSRDLMFATKLRDELPPDKPNIDGSTNGKPGVEYEYTIVTTEPGDDDVYYYIDWGDDNYENWFGPFDSGEEVTISHTWSEEGTYTISAKAKDIHGAESDWATLSVTMPVNQPSGQQSSTTTSTSTATTTTTTTTIQNAPSSTQSSPSVQQSSQRSAPTSTTSSSSSPTSK